MARVEPLRRKVKDAGKARVAAAMPMVQQSMMGAAPVVTGRLRAAHAWTAPRLRDGVVRTTLMNIVPYAHYVAKNRPDWWSQIVIQGRFSTALKSTGGR